MRCHSKALFAVAAVLALLILAPIAQAAPKGVVDSFGQRGTGAGQFEFPGGVAINQFSGDVYAVDVGLTGNASGSRIEQFTADGEFIRAWGWGVATGAEAFEACTSACQAGIRGSGNGQFSFQLEHPFTLASTYPQIAIDQSDGSVYVADTLNHRVQKFSATGDYLDQFGSEGSGDGQLNTPQGVAVDPVSKDVYVADTSNNRIQRFSDTGEYKSQIGTVGGGSGEGEFIEPRRIAVDSAGRLYVMDNGNARLQRFTSTGTFDGFFAPDVPLSGDGFVFNGDLTVDPANDHVFVSVANPGSSQGIYELDPAGQSVDTHGSGAGFSFGGVAVRSSSGKIFVAGRVSATLHQIVILDEVSPPTVAIEPVSDITVSSATFNGTVNPQGPPNANYRFEYSVDGQSWIGVPTSEVSLGEGTVDLEVSQVVTGLEPNTEYRVRLVSRKDFNAASATSAEVTFKTSATQPEVHSLEPGPVTNATAWVGAYVNPRNAPTTYYIEYSLDPGFPSDQTTSLPASKDASVGSSAAPTFVNAQIKGLQANTTYFYRVVATNIAGTTAGESRLVHTLSGATPPSHGLPDGRVWERVSPVDKQGADIEPGTGG